MAYLLAALFMLSSTMYGMHDDDAPQQAWVLCDDVTYALAKYNQDTLQAIKLMVATDFPYASQIVEKELNKVTKLCGEMENVIYSHFLSRKELTRLAQQNSPDRYFQAITKKLQHGGHLSNPDMLSKKLNALYIKYDILKTS